MQTETLTESIEVVAEQVAKKFSQWLGVPMQFRVGKSRILVEPTKPIQEYLLDCDKIEHELPGQVLRIAISDGGPLRQKRLDIITTIGIRMYTIRVKLQYTEGRTAILKNCGREYTITRECSMLAYADDDAVGVRTTLGSDFDKVMAQAIANGLDPREPWVMPFIAGMSKILQTSPPTPG